MCTPIQFLLHEPSPTSYIQEDDWTRFGPTRGETRAVYLRILENLGDILEGVSKYQEQYMTGSLLPNKQGKWLSSRMTC